jgi:hypothetical protein
VHSLELTYRQSTPMWDLRTAIDLTKLVANHGRRDSDRTLLHKAFADGSDTMGLKAGGRLLVSLDESRPKPPQRLPMGLYSRGGEPV